MTNEQKAALINAQIAIMNGERAMMEAANQERIHRGESLAYSEDAWIAFLNKWENMLGWNVVVGFFRD